MKNDNILIELKQYKIDAKYILSQKNSLYQPNKCLTLSEKVLLRKEGLYPAKTERVFYGK